MATSCTLRTCTFRSQGVQKPGRGLQVVCAAAPEPTARRSALAAGVAALAVMLQGNRAALAQRNAWDGSSSAIGSCPLDEGGDACRQAILRKDTGNLQAYGSQIDNSSKMSSTTTGVPVANLDTKYSKETQALAAKLLTYLTADPYDSARVKLAKELKTEGPTWVAAYARGGSARTVSARKMYIAVDAVAGHLAANGLAPFPSSKANKLVATIDEALATLAEGR